MSDRIAVMRGGMIEQFGTPREIYEFPRTRFTANFIGQTNLLEAEVLTEPVNSLLTVRCGEIILPVRSNHNAPMTVGEKAVLCLRMERVRYGTKPPEGFSLPATLTERRYTGGFLRSRLILKNCGEVIALGQDPFGSQVGEDVYVWWDPALVPIVPAEEAA
jgi:ABC-type Fe3+/spermidine/putrescine transport system ATPase subunit